MNTSIDRALTRDQVEAIRVELRSRGFDIRGDAGEFDAGRVSGVFMYDGTTLRVCVTKHAGLHSEDLAQRLTAGFDRFIAVADGLVPAESVPVEYRSQPSDYKGLPSDYTVADGEYPVRAIDFNDPRVNPSGANPSGDENLANPSANVYDRMKPNLAGTPVTPASANAAEIASSPKGTASMPEPPREGEYPVTTTTDYDTPRVDEDAIDETTVVEDEDIVTPPEVKHKSLKKR